MSLLLAGLMAQRTYQAAGKAGAAASVARSAATSADISSRKVEALEERVDSLSLLVLALVETLKARTGATDEEILKQVNFLDLRDGVADGKVTTSAKTCAKCSRSMAANHQRCLYCGGEGLTDAAQGSVDALLR